MRARFFIAVCLTALAIFLAWWHRRDDRQHAASPATTTATAAAPTTSAARRLDPTAFREHLARRRAEARALAERFASAAAAAARDDARPRVHHLADELVAPMCILGPADLCEAIAGAVDACDHGDGAACLAVGRFLEDGPPRPMILIGFYQAACEHDDQAGCAAAKRFDSDTPPDCAVDALACAWRAMNGAGRDGLDRACTFGVADACEAALVDVAGDAGRERGYLEAACRLGSPMPCKHLAERLSPRCTEHCYPPDPAAAEAATTIACAVGLTSLCTAVPL